MYYTSNFTFISNLGSGNGFVKFNILGLISYIKSISANTELDDSFICEYIRLWVEKLIMLSHMDMDYIHDIKLEKTSNNDTSKNYDIIINESDKFIKYFDISLDTPVEFSSVANLIYKQNNLLSENILYSEDEFEFDPTDSDDITIDSSFVSEKLADCEFKLSVIKYLIDNLNKNILGQNFGTKTTHKLKHLYLNHLIRKFKYLDSNIKKIGYNLRVGSWNFGPDLHNDKPTYRIRLVDSNGIQSGFFEKIINYIDSENKDDFETKNYYYLNDAEGEYQDIEFVEKYFNYLMDNTIW